MILGGLQIAIYNHSAVASEVKSSSPVGVKFKDLRCSNFMRQGRSTELVWLPLVWFDGLASYRQPVLPEISEFICILSSNERKFRSMCNKKANFLISSVYDNLKMGTNVEQLAQCKEKRLRNKKSKLPWSSSHITPPMDKINCQDIGLTKGAEASFADVNAMLIGIWFDGYFAGHNKKENVSQFTGIESAHLQQIVSACQSEGNKKIIDIIGKILK